MLTANVIQFSKLSKIIDGIYHLRIVSWSEFFLWLKPLMHGSLQNVGKLVKRFWISFNKWLDFLQFI